MFYFTVISNETVSDFQKLLKFKQQERLSAQQALKHPYFGTVSTLHRDVFLHSLLPVMGNLSVALPFAQ